MKFFYVLLCGVLFVSVSARADISIRFEPTQVSVGESTQLIFQSDKPISQAPDLTALQKNFVVSGQQQRQFSSTVNGKTEVRYEIIYNVFPRTQGQLSTGDIQIGSEKISGVTLTVSDSSTATDGRTIQVDAFVQQKEAYPGEMVLYTVKITESADLLDGEIRPPVIPDAQVSLLNMDKAYQTTVNGRAARVFERTFGIVPEKSGKITIPPAEFYGVVPAQQNRQKRDPFDFFEQGILFNGLVAQQKEVFLNSNPVPLNVLSKPAGWTGWWLPSQNVSLRVSDNFPQTLKVGDSLERVFTLTARGVSAEQLPIIQQPSSSDIKVYPSPEKRETIQTPTGDLQGVEELSVVIVPTQSGTITIPEVKIPWFNTQTRKIEVAIIPSKTISVQQVAGEKVIPEKIKTDMLSPDLKQDEPISPLGRQPHFSDLKGKMPSLYWVMALLGAGIIGGFMLGLFYATRRGCRNIKTPVSVASLHKHKSRKKKPVPDLYPF